MKPANMQGNLDCSIILEHTQNPQGERDMHSQCPSVLYFFIYYLYYLFSTTVTVYVLKYQKWIPGEHVLTPVMSLLEAHVHIQTPSTQLLALIDSRMIFPVASLLRSHVPVWHLLPMSSQRYQWPIVLFPTKCSVAVDRNRSDVGVSWG